MLFRTATEWVALLAHAQRQGRLEDELRRLEDELRRLERYPLLLCDEIGYIPFDPQAANLMFILVSRRYERTSLIVTSNKPFSAWGEISAMTPSPSRWSTGSSTTPRSSSLKGDSYRLKDRDLGRRPTEQPTD